MHQWLIEKINNVEQASLKKTKQTVNNLQHKHVFRLTTEVPQCGFGTSC